MQHADHVRLLRAGVTAGTGLPAGRTWADLGAGDGAFTLALAELLGAGGQIYAVDRDGGALRRLEQALPGSFAGLSLQTRRADFTSALDLPPLDGIVMANALHFVAPGRQAALLARLRGLLKPGGRFVIVEYNAEQGNLWVPHPVSWRRWQALAPEAGFLAPQQLASHPSSFLREFYSALAINPAGAPPASA